MASELRDDWFEYRLAAISTRPDRLVFTGEKSVKNRPAPIVDLAEAELDAFEEKCAGPYASIATALPRAWAKVIPFFGFDPATCTIIYTINPVESPNRLIRNAIKTWRTLPNEEVPIKLICLTIRRFENAGRNVREWFAARNQFAIMFAERFDA